MSLYSAIQFTSVSFLYASASNLGDFQVGKPRQFERDASLILLVVFIHRHFPGPSDRDIQ